MYSYALTPDASTPSRVPYTSNGDDDDLLNNPDVESSVSKNSAMLPGSDEGASSSSGGRSWKQKKYLFAAAGLGVLGLAAVLVGVVSTSGRRDGSVTATTVNAEAVSFTATTFDYTTLPPFGGECTSTCKVTKAGHCTPPSCTQPKLVSASYCDADVCEDGSCPAYTCPVTDFTACSGGTCQTENIVCTPKVCTPGECHKAVYEAGECSAASCEPDEVKSECNVTPTRWTPDIVGTAAVDRCVIGCSDTCTGTVTCTCPCSTYTIGFYMQSFKPWPPSCSIKRDTLFLTSGLTYDQVLNFPNKDVPKGYNQIFQLAAQYIGAKLNQCNGACISTDISNGLKEALALLTSKPKFQDVLNSPTCQNGITMTDGTLTRSCGTLSNLFSAFNGANEC